MMNCFQLKVRIVSISLIVAVTALSDIEEWEHFKIQHHKLYPNRVEDNLRYNIFVQNLRKIHEHNDKYYNGDTTFEMGVTKFADMTVEEFQNFLGYQKSDKPYFGEKKEYFSPQYNLFTPDFINWTAMGAVTNVKDQGDCGSCWSFSTVGTIEGQYSRKMGKLVSMSAQNLVDCDRSCAGCNGGLMQRALKYIKKNGIYTETEYPYRGIDEPCEVHNSSGIIRIIGYNFVKENDENDLQKAVATIGPISVAISASDNFQLYNSGILDDNDCGNTKYDLNHAVLAVGYGTENGKDYWIVKNSWGSSWGENGYIRMSRNAKNQCGIAAEPIYAIL